MEITIIIIDKKLKINTIDFRVENLTNQTD